MQQSRILRRTDRTRLRLSRLHFSCAGPVIYVILRRHVRIVLLSGSQTFNGSDFQTDDVRNPSPFMGDRTISNTISPAFLRIRSPYPFTNLSTTVIVAIRVHVRLSRGCCYKQREYGDGE